MEMEKIENVLLSRRIRENSVIRNVAIVGGTHGNELHGVQMIRHYMVTPSKVKRSSFETQLLIGNPAAVANKGTGAGTRYVDEDLNRCFLASALYRDRSDDSLTVEEKRAREVDELLGPKHSCSPKTDFIFDLHNTTSNTGTLLCFHPDDKFALALAAHLLSQDPSIVMCQWPPGDRGLLPTVARAGMTVEVGAVSHSTVNSRLLLQTMTLVERGLDFIEMWNQRAMSTVSENADPSSSSLNLDPPCLPLFKGVGKLDYPRDQDGNLIGFIHPELQGVQELTAAAVLRVGAPLFLMIDGSTQTFTQDLKGLDAIDWNKEVYLLFVNEAAYYEQACACALAQKC
jgi:hypothetical protein